ncbi:MAG: hypothetical protein ACI9RO_002079 [Alteromonas macleodii]|jgi:hypothetical protein
MKEKEALWDKYVMGAPTASLIGPQAETTTNSIQSDIS